MRIEEISWNKTATDSIKIMESSKLLIKGELEMYKDFVYSDEYVENCAELELSFYLAIGIIGVFIIIIIIVAIAVIMSFSYKSKYQQLMDKENLPKESKEETSILLHDY